MKSILKTLLAVAMCATFSNAFAESYTLDSKQNGVVLKLALQGGGAVAINDKSISKLLQCSSPCSIHQTVTLNADYTYTGSITSDAVSFTGSNLMFNVTGTWRRPLNGKIIYVAPDGDPTLGTASDGGYGLLFNRSKATWATVPDLMPILFWNKVSNVDLINPSIKLTTGIIKLQIDKNGVITSATTTMLISGRALTSYCKLDQYKECTISKGTKDAKFSFGINAKSTVTTL